MKTIQKVLSLCAALAFLPTANAGVAFTVSPSVVSNTYNGYLTLVVTGLTNGETVVVQKFLDVNGNGVIDAHEPLWQQFTLTDGTNSQVAGVTNINVPGDGDAVSGQITARINFSASFAQQIAGNYLFELSSPSGHFLPVTNSLLVTGYPFPESFTGTVFDNGVPAPYAGVILFQTAPGNLSDLSPVAGAVANSSGSYSIAAPPGTYALSAFGPNVVGNIAAAAGLVLTNGANVSTNLALLTATSSIQGRIQVAGNSSQGVPGLLVPVQTSSGLLGICFSDTNGNFNAAVTANQWKLTVDSSGTALAGVVGLQGKTVVNTTTGSVAGATINLPLGNALFYGTVKDVFGNLLPAPVEVAAYDNDFNIFESVGTTDGNGNFAITALGGLGAGDPWTVQVENTTSFPGYIFSQPGFAQYGGTNLSAGQAVPASIAALWATNQISGRLQTSAGQPIAGVGVSAFALIDGFNFNAYADTDTNGNYVFTVGNGTWNISINTQYGSDSLNTNLGAGTFQYPVGAVVNITNNNAVANFTIEPCEGVLISTTSLPGAQTGFFYNQQLQGSTCTGTENWSVNDPQDFPPNLALTSFGQIQGTPTNTGTYSFSVHLNDGSGHSTNQSLSLTVSGPSTNSLPVITTTNLTNATQNSFYTTTLAASGGQPPYSWSLSGGSANLPAGLTLGTNGVLSGTPIGSGSAQFIVVVTDSTAAWTYQIMTLTVNASSLPQKINLALPAQVTPGTIQFSFKIASGLNYTIQTSPDLRNWADYETLDFSNGIPTSGENWLVTLPQSNATQGFYRVKVGQ